LNAAAAPRGRRRVLIVLAVLALFGFVFALRLIDHRPNDAVVLLYTVPIAIAAIEFGRWIGLVAGALGLALFVLYTAIGGSGVGALGYVSRAVAFLILGWLLGAYVDRQRRAARERERADAGRREAEAQSTRFFEMGQDLFATASFDGYFTRVNDAWERLFGYTSEELMARPYIELIHPDDIEATFAAAGSLAEGSSEVVNFENRYLAKDGSWLWLLWAARSDERQVYAVAKDITERKRMEAQLASTARDLDIRAAELRRSNAELEQFAYVASHDLAEPLRSVAGFSQLLERRYSGKLDEEADEFLAFIVDGTERMRALIDGLLSYSRVGRAEIEREPVDCQVLVRRTADALSAAIDEKQATVIAERLPTVAGDAALLGQVLQNLLGNALKFSDGEPPRVEIAAYDDAGDWHFTVTDNGIGIDPEYAERVFGMFQRLHGRDSYPGTGIGLAVCRRIVERHEGTIWVEPRPEGGSRFHFTLPGH
jgi:chemotaxis family two-component system sensor kinase Cph1